MRMSIVKQVTSLNILNEEFEDDGRCRKRGKLFPSTIRSNIVGPSNCRKTNVMVNLNVLQNGLKFENAEIYSQ